MALYVSQMHIWQDTSTYLQYPVTMKREVSTEICWTKKFINTVHSPVCFVIRMRFHNFFAKCTLSQETRQNWLGLSDLIRSFPWISWNLYNPRYKIVSTSSHADLHKDLLYALKLPHLLYVGKQCEVYIN